MEIVASDGSALLAVDVADDIGNGLKLLGFFIRHFDIEFLFKGHHQFNGVERVGSEVFNEFGLWGDLVGVDAELVDDDVLYTVFDAFVLHCWGGLSWSWRCLVS